MGVVNRCEKISERFKMSAEIRRFITHCPECETEFFVNDEQLGKHAGKVRCGQCLHVFDAKIHEIESSIESEKNDASEVLEIEQAQVTNNNESVTNEPIADEALINTPINHLDDLANHSPFNKKRKSKKVANWVLVVFALLLLLAAITQSVYFLRTEIATYYPITKPYLVKACELVKCTVELPKKIDLIAIDDSDIQEDAEYKDLMRFSSTLINQAGFNQQFPNIELSLTDVDDKPLLRRVFKPSEYLPSEIDIAAGLAPGQEIKINLAITARDAVVSGYRVFVTY